MSFQPDNFFEIPSIHASSIFKGFFATFSATVLRRKKASVHRCVDLEQLLELWLFFSEPTGNSKTAAESSTIFVAHAHSE